MKSSKKGFAFIGMVIAAAVVVWLMYVLLTAYFKPSPAGVAIQDNTVKQASGVSPDQQGRNTSSYIGVAESTRKTLDTIHDQRMQDIDSLLQ